LVDGDYLLIDQSALTGESLPVEKHPADLAYASSTIRQGEMNALVVTTGMSTYFGRTTKLVEEAQTASHFQRAVIRIGDTLVIAVRMVMLIGVVGLVRHQGVGELLQFGLVLAVAAIPAAMPAVLSVSMAVGAEALAKKEAIVSKLVALEELAGADILCADKTGTITKNEPTVGEVRPIAAYSETNTLLLAALASREEDKDPIDDTIIEKAKEVGALPAQAQRQRRRRRYTILAFKPFDPVSKRTEATKDLSTRRSPDVITAASTIESKPDAEAEAIAERADGFAEVFPEHKYRIVELLQKRGHIVCMTGDGVNDAPALKKADVGIAVAGATDAAKSAADVVLTRPGLSVIIDAFKESRKIFQRMTNYATYRIAETIRVLVFVTFSIIGCEFYPVTALMIVLLALLNDLPIMTIAYDNVRYSDKPEKWNMRNLLTISTFLGAVGVVSSFVLLYIGVTILHLGTGLLESLIFLKLAVAGHLTLFVARTRGTVLVDKAG
jgi:magnesium-transporting ATPase (P-type)